MLVRIKSLKMQRFESIAFRVIFVSLLCWFSACAPSIAPFSARAYEMTVDLKVDALKTIKRAEDPWEEHADRIEALQTRLSKAYEFSAGRPRNELSTEQWLVMLDPEGYLLGGMLARWRKDSTLSPVFIHEASLLVEAGFDSIIRLESGKVKGRESNAN